MSRVGTSGVPTVPGPVDRESFFAAQRRHRRAARWYGLLTMVGVLLVGIPLSALLTPLLAMLALVALHVTSLGLALWTPDVLATSTTWLADTFGPYLTDPDQRRTVLTIGVPVALVAPGAIVQALLYLRVRRLFRRAGADGLLAEIGARAPRSGDPRERQLVNTVAEMGIAAGLAPPRVMIVDPGPGSPGMNAAVVGPTPDQATVVIGRAMLEGMDRDTTQAVVAYLVAFAANGDLRIATTTIAARMTTVAIQHVLEAPASRASLGVRRALLRPGRRDRAGTRVRDLLRMLRDEPGGGAPDRTGWLGAPFRFVFGVPFALASPCYSASSAILWALFMRPWQGRFLRARSAQADATAVQLTRMPDPLARAVAIVDADSTPLGGGWPTDLSVFVGAEAPRSEGEWLRARPPAGVRLWRLRRMGARVDRGVVAPRRILSRLIRGTLAAPFVLAGYALGLGAVGLAMSISVVIGLMVFLFAYSGVVSLILLIPLLIELVPQLLDAVRG
jgi:Zn-dependent protease with chaperone function